MKRNNKQEDQLGGYFSDPGKDDGGLVQDCNCFKIMRFWIYFENRGGGTW